MNNTNTDKASDILPLAISGLYESRDVDSLKSWSEGVQRETKDLSERLQKKIRVLIDLRAAIGYTDPKVLIVFAELMKANDPYVLKTATFGGTKEHEMAEEMIKMFALRNNLKNFKTEEEAITWLNS